MRSSACKHHPFYIPQSLQRDGGRTNDADRKRAKHARLISSNLGEPACPRSDGFGVSSPTVGESTKKVGSSVENTRPDFNSLFVEMQNTLLEWHEHVDDAYRIRPMLRKKDRKKDKDRTKELEGRLWLAEEQNEEFNDTILTLRANFKVEQEARRKESNTADKLRAERDAMDQKRRNALTEQHNLKLLLSEVRQQRDRAEILSSDHRERAEKAEKTCKTAKWKAKTEAEDSVRWTESLGEAWRSELQEARADALRWKSRCQDLQKRYQPIVDTDQRTSIPAIGRIMNQYFQDTWQCKLHWKVGMPEFSFRDGEVVDIRRPS